MSEALNTNTCDDDDDDNHNNDNNHNHNTNTFSSQQRINLLNHSPSSLNSVILQSSSSSEKQQQQQQQQDDKYLNLSIDINKFPPFEGTDWAKSKQQHNNNNIQQSDSIHQPQSTTWTTRMLNTINSQQQMQDQQSFFANNINDIQNHNINTLNRIDNYNSSLPFPDQNIDTDEYYHRALHGISNHDLMNHFDYNNNNNNYNIDNNNYHHHHQQSKVQNASMQQQQQQQQQLSTFAPAADGSVITLLPPSWDQKEGKEDVGIHGDDDNDDNNNKTIQIPFSDYHNADNVDNNNDLDVGNNDNLDNHDIPGTASNINNAIQQIPFPATQEELPSYHDKTWRIRQDVSYVYTCLYCLNRFKGSAHEHITLHYGYFDSNKPYKCHKCHLGYAFKHLLTQHNNQHHVGDGGDLGDDNDNLDNTIQQIPFPKTQEELPTSHLNKTWKVKQSDKNGEYTCLYCLKDIKYTQHHFALHYDYFDPNKPYKCDKCYVGYGHTGHLVRHNNQHHGGSNQQHGGSVEHTSDNGKEEEEDDDHDDDDINPKPIQIPFPATQEELPTSHLNKTWRVRHKDRGHTCLYCLNPYRGNPQEHLTLHHAYFDSNKPYKCDKCHLGYQALRALTQHNNQHHGGGDDNDIQQIPFPKTKEELPTSYHGRTWISRQDGNDMCLYCLNLITHIRSHFAVHRAYFDSKKPYKCDKCHLAYQVKSNLARHNKQHHGGSVKHTSDNEEEEDDGNEEENDGNEEDDDAEEKDEDGRQDTTHQDDDDDHDNNNNIPTQIIFPENSQELPVNCDDTTWYTCTDDGMYICRYCLQSYPNHNSLSQHLKHHYGYFHSNKPHKCYKCYLGYPTAWHLVVHNGVKHIDSDEDEDDDDTIDDDTIDDDTIDDVDNNVNAMDEQIDFQHSQQNMSLSPRNQFNKAGSDGDGEDDDDYNNNNQYEYDMTNPNMIKLNNMKNTNTHTIASDRRGLNSGHNQAVTTDANNNNNNNVNQQLTNAQTSLNTSANTNNTLLTTDNNNNIFSQSALPAPSLSLLKNVFPNINNAHEKDNINHHNKKNNNHNPTHGNNNKNNNPFKKSDTIPVSNVLLQQQNNAVNLPFFHPPFPYHVSSSFDQPTKSNINNDNQNNVINNNNNNTTASTAITTSNIFQQQLNLQQQEQQPQQHRQLNLQQVQQLHQPIHNQQQQYQSTIIELKNEIKILKQNHEQQLENERQDFLQQLLAKDQYYKEDLNAKNQYIAMLTQLVDQNPRKNEDNTRNNEDTTSNKQ